MDKLEGLNPRLREVLALIAEGLPLKAVAQRLAISDATLDGHRRELLRQFGVDSTRALRVHAALLFDISGVTPREPAVAWLKHQSHFLPNVQLSDRHIYSQPCRLRFHCDVLRDVAALLRSARLWDGRLPVSCRADVVYFDVRRRTLRGELLVRAAYDIVQTTGRWNPRTGEIVDLAEDEPSTLCQVFDYTLVQRWNAWRVVAKEPVGSQDGGPPSFYDRSTGAFVQDTGT